MKNKKLKMEKGFTLVEMIVAIGLFTIILFISTSAFLTVLSADRKSRATRIAMDNLNLSLEDISRRIKTGNTYNCGGTGGTADCTMAAPEAGVFAVTDQGGERIIYKRGIGANPVTAGNGPSGCGSSSYAPSQGCIVRDKNGIALRVTGPEIDITDLQFIVQGSTVWTPTGRDVSQPYVVIFVGGTTPGKITTGFKMQTTVTQRAYDI